MSTLVLRNLTLRAFCFGFGFEETVMNPLCNPIFVWFAACERPTKTSLAPYQPDALRYNQTAVADAINVTKNIKTSANILYLLKTSPFGLASDSR